MRKENNLNSEYIRLIKENSAEYQRDYLHTKEKVAASTAIYKGLPVPFLYQPFFLSVDDEKVFSNIIETMMSICDKLTEKYVSDKNFRKKFSFPEFIEKMILLDSKYGVNIPIGRFDIFYKNGEEFKFCELNTDGSSAMNEDAVIGNILLESDGLRKFGQNKKLECFELFDSLVSQMLFAYKKVSDTIPNVAIVDILSSGSMNEFERFKRTFEAHGVSCRIVDVRDLVYRDGALYDGDYRVDLIYRRLVVYELIEYASQCKDFISAYMDGAVTVCGSLRSQVIHTKEFFKVLCESETLALLSDDERDFVRKHVPYTASFSRDKAVYERVLNNKDAYILKPNDRNASQGVFAGLDYTCEEWERRIGEVFDKDYIYQEFVTPYRRDYVEFDGNGSVSVASYGAVVGLFTYFKKFAGCYIRLGKDNIISTLSDYYTAPAVVVRDRDE